MLVLIDFCMDMLVVYWLLLVVMWLNFGQMFVIYVFGFDDIEVLEIEDDLMILVIEKVYYVIEKYCFGLGKLWWGLMLVVVFGMVVLGVIWVLLVFVCYVVDIVLLVQWVEIGWMILFEIECSIGGVCLCLVGDMVCLKLVYCLIGFDVQIVVLFIILCGVLCLFGLLIVIGEDLVEGQVMFEVVVGYILFV